MSKTKMAEKSKAEKIAQNGSLPLTDSVNENNNGAGKSAARTLQSLNKTYAAARTKKEKDEARKALTLAAFNAIYESHQKRRS